MFEVTARNAVLCRVQVRRRTFEPLFAMNAVKAIVKSMPDEMADDLPNEETDSPDFADQQNFYKVEKWTKDGTKVDRMLYAGNNLDKARLIFSRTTKQRPRIRLTVRQRMQVLDEWPRYETLL